jgi:hypothetical protein
MPIRLALALLLLLAATGCRREPGPVESYRAFDAAEREGDADRVWSLLAAGSRAAFEARARELSARAPAGVLAVSGRSLVLGDLSALAPRPSSVTLARESGDAAVVAVEVEGRPAREVALVREGGAWRVVVPFDN